MRWLFLVLVLAGCSAGNGGDNSECDTGCVGTSGACLSCPSVYSCNSGGTCGPITDGIACCDGQRTGGGVGCCAAWSCNGSASCAASTGAPSGGLCGFGDVGSCNTWCGSYFPGNCTCSC